MGLFNWHKHTWMITGKGAFHNKGVPSTFTEFVILYKCITCPKQKAERVSSQNTVAIDPKWASNILKVC
ncbi:hypothetical protein UFOVP276_11 [uncultured Caudovirales phage]|uniref:Uncharacterized protein n=1 Tax=uncultured Caudovirales phage TaxID=2100421 RepID=A0A6J5LIT1_9CAUD|nr:hypothetical protein UFOVP127_148 [uncultured Caudovirales phage]CAB4134782.1 hypothetical protein UFOVP276_11 [uncultured Caudovirales phage]